MVTKELEVMKWSLKLNFQENQICARARKYQLNKKECKSKWKFGNGKSALLIFLVKSANQLTRSI